MSDRGGDRAGVLLRKVFDVLMANPEGLLARDVIARVEAELGLTEFERSFYPNTPGIRRFDKIIRFYTIASVKAGWLLKDKGRWTLTTEGRMASERYPDPAALKRESDRLYREWRRGQPEPEEAEALEADTPGAATTLEEAEESAWSEIDAYLAKMNPYDLQNLVAGLLRGMGYHVSWIAPPGPDRGIDVIAHRDPLGVEGGRIKVQVKRRADKISVVEIRSFLAVLGEDEVGIFVTTSGFTSDAEAEARAQERRRIMLLDAPRLFDLWVEHYASVPEEQRRLLPLKAIHFLVPRDE